MTITDADRQELADLAMRALDTIVADYGDDATLEAASLVFEVKTLDDDGVQVWHGNYNSLERNGPHHIAGLHIATAAYLLNPQQP
jgi:dihydrodipicolinate synthase/N-acetylneuraminate lyase